MISRKLKGKVIGPRRAALWEAPNARQWLRSTPLETQNSHRSMVMLVAAPVTLVAAVTMIDHLQMNSSLQCPV